MQIMGDIFSVSFFMMLLQIVMVDILLGGDNAIVIAMAAEKLPHRLQKTAIILGTGGAIVIRFLMAFAVVWLLHIPYLRIVGAVLLIAIGIHLLQPKKQEEHVKIKEESGLLQAVAVIITADATMSLDNIMGIVGVAQGNIWLVGLGMCISVPIIMFGSEFFIYLIDRFPVILYLGGVILGWAAGGMFVSDPSLEAYTDKELLFRLASMAVILGAAALMHVRARGKKKDDSSFSAPPGAQGAGK